MAKKIFLLLAVVLAALGLLGSGFLLGFEVGREVPNNTFVHVSEVKNINPPGSVAADFGIFWQAWSIIRDQYLHDPDVSAQAKVYGAVEGLVHALGDPNSAFFNPSDNKRFQEDIQGNFGGIGAELGIRDSRLVIVAPLKDTPAMRAGLKAGDYIVLINGSSTERITIEEAVRTIRGPEGTPVTLAIYRDDFDEPRDFTITRARIAVPTLDFEMRDTIAYVQLYSFNENSNSLFHNAIQEASNRGARGLILDLRNNPGGYLSVAIDLAGWFLPRGTIVVSEESRTQADEVFRAGGNEALKDMPVVVLVNGGSASASEILAGTLRDNRNTLLIGEQTFGKGTVQQLEPLPDGASLKITIAHWVLPSGAIIEGEGLAPDIVVESTDEDRDPQLERALEEIRKLL